MCIPSPEAAQPSHIIWLTFFIWALHHKWPHISDFQMIFNERPISVHLSVYTPDTCAQSGNQALMCSLAPLTQWSSEWNYQFNTWMSKWKMKITPLSRSMRIALPSPSHVKTLPVFLLQNNTEDVPVTSTSMQLGDFNVCAWYYFAFEQGSWQQQQQQKAAGWLHSISSHLKPPLCHIAHTHTHTVQWHNTIISDWQATCWCFSPCCRLQGLTLLLSSVCKERAPWGRKYKLYEGWHCLYTYIYKNKWLQLVI